MDSELTTNFQEVDVVVLPSLLQPDVSTKAVKRAKKVLEHETGNKQVQVAYQVVSLGMAYIVRTAVGTHIQLNNEIV